MGQKTIIVTGANTGIGFKATSMLARQGHEVILACRSEEKGNAAVEEIKQKQANACVMFMKLDLASLASVRAFVDAFHNTGKSLDVLLCNAGLATNFYGTERQLTQDGFELTMGTNHLGHFLLTNLLIDDLKSTAQSKGESRIVIVSSLMHDVNIAGRMGVKITDIEDINLEKPGAYIGGAHAYKNSKLANILFALELDERLKGTGVLVNSVHPGFIPGTEFNRNASCCIRCFVSCCFGFCLRPCGVTQSPSTGGEALVQQATSDKIKGVSGRYYNVMVEAEPGDEAKDETKRKRLWEISASLVGLTKEEEVQLHVP